MTPSRQSRQSHQPKRVPGRPRRGRPEDTRARLVAAATREFEQAGYGGTDSNRLARAAGYAPGVFYRHFGDKRALFLEVYREWVEREWTALASLERGAAAPQRARAIVDLVFAWHAEHRGLRRSLRALVASDDLVRAAYQQQRARQLDWLAELAPAMPRERAALLLYTVERAADGAADGEPAALGMDAGKLARELAKEITPFLKP